MSQKTRVTNRRLLPVSATTEDAKMKAEKIVLILTKFLYISLHVCHLNDVSFVCLFVSLLFVEPRNIIQEACLLLRRLNHWL